LGRESEADEQLHTLLSERDQRYHCLPVLLNEHEVAEILNVSVASVRRWRLLGRGPRFLKIGASVRYRSEELSEWLEKRPTGGAHPDGAARSWGRTSMHSTSYIRSAVPNTATAVQCACSQIWYIADICGCSLPNRNDVDMLEHFPGNVSRGEDGVLHLVRPTRRPPCTIALATQFPLTGMGSSLTLDWISWKLLSIWFEGIVGKRRTSAYRVTEKPSRDWIKVKNPNYSHAEGRAEMFDDLQGRAIAKAAQ